jgi:hypothetical protein
MAVGNTPKDPEVTNVWLLSGKMPPPESRFPVLCEDFCFEDRLQCCKPLPRET